MTEHAGWQQDHVMLGRGVAFAIKQKSPPWKSFAQIVRSQREAFRHVEADILHIREIAEQVVSHSTIPTSDLRDAALSPAQESCDSLGAVVLVLCARAHQHVVDFYTKGISCVRSCEIG